MKIRTHLGNTIEAVDSVKIRYDKNVKEILADIQEQSEKINNYIIGLK